MIATVATYIVPADLTADQWRAVWAEAAAVIAQHVRQPDTSTIAEPIGVMSEGMLWRSIAWAGDIGFRVDVIESAGAESPDFRTCAHCSALYLSGEIWEIHCPLHRTDG